MTKRDQRGARAAMEALRWLIMPSRPGSLEELDALIGVDVAGETVEVRVSGDGKVVFVTAAGEEVVAHDETVARLFDGRFQPRQVRTKSDFRRELFKSAIVAAEIATTNEIKANESLSQVAEERDGETDWEFFWSISHLEETIPPSLQAVVFAIATSEAQANAWGQWEGAEDRAPVEKKLRRLARDAGGQLTLGEGPGGWFLEGLELRDRIVHAKPASVATQSLVESNATTSAGRGRRICVGVRHVLIELARLRGESPPAYLKLCPTDADNLSEWRTGARMLRDSPQTELQ